MGPPIASVVSSLTASPLAHTPPPLLVDDDMDLPSSHLGDVAGDLPFPQFEIMTHTSSMGLDELPTPPPPPPVSNTSSSPVSTSPPDGKSQSHHPYFTRRKSFTTGWSPKFRILGNAEETSPALPNKKRSPLTSSGGHSDSSSKKRKSVQSPHSEATKPTATATASTNGHEEEASDNASASSNSKKRKRNRDANEASKAAMHNVVWDEETDVLLVQYYLAGYTYETDWLFLSN